MKKRVIIPPSNPQRRVELMQVLDMILDVLAYIWYGIKRIFKNPVLRDAAIILLSAAGCSSKEENSYRIIF